jgi:preprotein translocase subunit SecE
MIQKLREYFLEAKAEVKKVTWPDRKATSASTVVVLVVVVVIGVYLAVVDVVLSQVYKLVL